MNRHARGATLIEFCLVLLMFLMVFLGLLDFSRMLFTWNAATEAARAGARYAVVCAQPGSGTGSVLAKMQALLPEVEGVALAWTPAGCTPATCQGLTLTITDLRFRWIAPLPGSVPPLWDAMSVNQFSTYLPREAMHQDPNSAALCD
ncbi:MAG TPA: TadE family protein [Telluria sp.]|nr:TadE family protein [Telluria sp.]